MGERPPNCCGRKSIPSFIGVGLFTTNKFPQSPSAVAELCPQDKCNAGLTRIWRTKSGTMVPERSGLIRRPEFTHDDIRFRCWRVGACWLSVDSNAWARTTRPHEG